MPSSLTNFGKSSKTAKTAVRSLFAEIGLDEVQKWRETYWNTNGFDPGARLPIYEKLAKDYSVSDFSTENELSGAKLLYAIQSYYVNIVNSVVFGRLGAKFATNFPEIDLKCGQKIELPPEQGDRFAGLYQNLIPAAIRKVLGEFYTPYWLAKQVLTTISAPDDRLETVLDPACGSGVFLLATVEKMRQSGHDLNTILRSIKGFDLNPLAVITAKANFALALEATAEIPIFIKDTLEESSFEEKFDLILGNPPWVQWDKLSPAFREKTFPLWEKYGLFSLGGTAVRYGGAKKELALLFLLLVAERYLKDGGKLGMVLPQRVFQTREAGEGFRKFLLPSNVPLKVCQVDDFSELRPFGSGIASKVATIALEKGAETQFPLAYRKWDKVGNVELLEAKPLDPRKPASPWSISRPGVRLATVSVSENNLAAYRAYLGANTGGANGVYWLEIVEDQPGNDRHVLVRNLADCGKKQVSQIVAEIESALLFPLLRWGEVDRFGHKKPSVMILVPQDPTTRVGILPEIMRQKYPKAFRYLSQFEEMLRSRAAFRKYHREDSPFYSMYNVGEQTFAPFKLVWRRMDTRIRATVVQGRLIPQETCAIIPCETLTEADYLAAILNSNTVEYAVNSFSPVGGKGFGSPGFLKHLPIPKFDLGNPEHLVLAQFGKKQREN